MATQNPPIQSFTLKAIIMVVLCLAIGGIGGLFTADSVKTWYLELNQPSFNPPNWLFGPVWTVLYILMGLSAAIIWHQGTNKPGVKLAMGIFGIQLILNSLWTIIFFGMHNIGLALIDIFALLFWIGIMVKLFGRIHRWAGYLLWPYLLWVAFAAYLNFAYWQLN